VKTNEDLFPSVLLMAISAIVFGIVAVAYGWCRWEGIAAGFLGGFVVSVMQGARRR